jgi:hypothetical protein
VEGPRRTAVAFAAWTLFVWLTRVRNTVGDDDLSSAGKAATLVLCASFVVLACLVLESIFRRTDRRQPLVALLTLWTTVVWVVRSVQIATGGHSAGFVAVHITLGVISIVLGAVAVRAGSGFLSRRDSR